MRGMWYFSADHNQLCQVIESQTPWGETTCRVWPWSVCLRPGLPAGAGTNDGIAYVSKSRRFGAQT
jgi:hypothetical protein